MQPFCIVECGKVTKPGVTQYGDDRLARSQLPRESDRTGYIDTRGQAETQPFLVEQAANPVQTLFIRNAKLGVDRRAIKIGGDPALSNPLGNGIAFGLQLAIGVIAIAFSMG